MPFPGHVSDPESYWRLLIEGTDAITDIPIDRWDADKYYDPDPNPRATRCIRGAAVSWTG